MACSMLAPAKGRTRCGGNRDAHARLVHVLDGRDRRARRDHVGCLDLDVGSREGDFFGARGFGADQADVPDIPAGLIRKLPWLWKRHRPFAGIPKWSAIALARLGETPSGSPDAERPVTSRKLDMLIAARRITVRRELRKTREVAFGYIRTVPLSIVPTCYSPVPVLGSGWADDGERAAPIWMLKCG